jgi:hypothetical protein
VGLRDGRSLSGPGGGVYLASHRGHTHLADHPIGREVAAVDRADPGPAGRDALKGILLTRRITVRCGRPGKVSKTDNPPQCRHEPPQIGVVWFSGGWRQ